MKDYLFKSWGTWKASASSSIRSFVRSYVKIMYCIVFGIISVLYAGCKGAISLIKDFPSHFLGLLCVILSVACLFTYVNMAHRVKFYEIQRDSISYEIYKIEQALKGDTIVVGYKIKRGDGAMNHGGYANASQQ